MQKIKFWSIYLFIIILIQMLFIVIYNIPIYKIYCELNNYYSIDNTLLFFDKKIFLYNNIDYYNNLYYYINYYNIEIFNILKYNFYNNYFYNFLYKFNFFYYDFLYYNFFNFLKFYSIQEELNIKIIYIIYFNTSITNLNLVEFISLQNYIYVFPGETYLSFFRLYNPTNYFIKGITIYLISPFEISLYFYKIQCFCFDELIIYPFESIDLPILFYLDSNINNFIYLENLIFFQIQILYLFILNSFYIY
jgi:cytochrome c oxidase assembly protein Cox11